MRAQGLVVGSVGNVSAREPGGLRITPTRTHYDRLRRRDLVRVDLDGAVRGGALRRAPIPSQELPLHLAVYRARPDAGAIVHTHSPHAAAWSFRGEPLAPRTEDMDYYDVGAVRCAQPAPAGSEGLAEAAVRALGSARAVLLGEHGVLALGATPEEALVVAQVVEHQAQVAWLLASDGRSAGVVHHDVIAPEREVPGQPLGAVEGRLVGPRDVLDTRA